MAFAMFWEIFWALALGFLLSAVVQAVVSKGEMGRLLPDSSLKSLWRASWLGAASSSCSYAAVAIARSMVAKGADFTAAFAFEFASTNLVIELGIILWLLLGWQFAVAEYVSGFLMILILSGLFRVFLKPGLMKEAVAQAQQVSGGGHEGHGMGEETRDVWYRRLLSGEGLTSVSRYFVMDVSMLWKEIMAGLLITGALSAWVPQSFWQHFFLAGESGVGPAVWGAVVGPLVAMLSFVCSIGNVPLAAVLWNGGISFAGVISFIFADLLILPILSIYRKYYGMKMAVFLAAMSYLAMVLAGLVTEAAFRLLGLVPSTRQALVLEAHIGWNYTSVLNAVFVVGVAVLVWRNARAGKGEEHCEHHGHH